ncbi:septum site-determining protein MinC [Priestia abyssalis]|uniref:septum site-determining protein MinC n=1 Tax=Priestia abyssalis TaxID=1221450 RepID=UPI002E26F3E2|nr:septum site-determining protein MinC [Priestia abyssalis]
MNVVNRQKQHNVVIKGTKDGLTLHLDDTCSFQELISELETKLSTNQHGDNQQLVAVQLKIGNRYLTPEQEEQLKAVVNQKNNLAVNMIDSNVVSKEEAVRLKEEEEIVSISKIVRSGQVLQVSGDLLLVGDVNPGGTVIAGGNIFILGALRGIAHAGYSGNIQAVIGASVIENAQLRINDAILNPTENGGHKEASYMQCAYLDEDGEMVMERVQSMPQLRPNLTRLERRN